MRAYVADEADGLGMEDSVAESVSRRHEILVAVETTSHLTALMRVANPAHRPTTNSI